MSDYMKYVYDLADDIGPRPANTEEEHQAAEQIADWFAAGGVQAEIEEFECPTMSRLPYLIAYLLMFIAVLFTRLRGAAAVVMFIIALIALALFLCERYYHPIFGSRMGHGLSQNVLAKVKPSEGAPKRNRKVVVMTRYDSSHASLEATPPFDKFRRPLQIIMFVCMVILPILMIFQFIPGLRGARGTLWVISLIISLVPLAGAVFVVVRRYAMRFSDGANDNASGVAAMMEVFNRIQGLSDEGENVDGEMKEGSELHDEEQAYAAGVVPEDARLNYAVSRRTGGEESAPAQGEAAETPEGQAAQPEAAPVSTAAQSEQTEPPVATEARVKAPAASAETPEPAANQVPAEAHPQQPHHARQARAHRDGHTAPQRPAHAGRRPAAPAQSRGGSAPAPHRAPASDQAAAKRRVAQQQEPPRPKDDVPEAFKIPAAPGESRQPQPLPVTHAPVATAQASPARTSNAPAPHAPAAKAAGAARQPAPSSTRTARYATHTPQQSPAQRRSNRPKPSWWTNVENRRKEEGQEEKSQATSQSEHVSGRSVYADIPTAPTPAPAPEPEPAPAPVAVDQGVRVLTPAAPAPSAEATPVPAVSAPTEPAAADPHVAPAAAPAASVQPAPAAPVTPVPAQPAPIAPASAETSAPAAAEPAASTAAEPVKSESASSVKQQPDPVAPTPAQTNVVAEEAPKPEPAKASEPQGSSDEDIDESTRAFLEMNGMLPAQPQDAASAGSAKKAPEPPASAEATAPESDAADAQAQEILLQPTLEQLERQAYAEANAAETSRIPTHRVRMQAVIEQASGNAAIQQDSDAGSTTEQPPVRTTRTISARRSGTAPSEEAADNMPSQVFRAEPPEQRRPAPMPAEDSQPTAVNARPVSERDQTAPISGDEEEYDYEDDFEDDGFYDDSEFESGEFPSPETVSADQESWGSRVKKRLSGLFHRKSQPEPVEHDDGIEAEVFASDAPEATADQADVDYQGFEDYEDFEDYDAYDEEAYARENDRETLVSSTPAEVEPQPISPAKQPAETSPVQVAPAEVVPDEIPPVDDASAAKAPAPLDIPETTADEAPREEPADAPEPEPVQAEPEKRKEKRKPTPRKSVRDRHIPHVGITGELEPVNGRRPTRKNQRLAGIPQIESDADEGQRHDQEVPADVPTAVEPADQAPAAQPASDAQPSATAYSRDRYHARRRSHREESDSAWEDLADGVSADDWKGGAASVAKQPAKENAELREEVEEVARDRRPSREVWFLAVGASEQANAGINAFLAEHAQELRGATFINLRCVGAGSLAALKSEGVGPAGARSDRRSQTLAKRAAKATRHELEFREAPAIVTDAVPVLHSRHRAITLMAFDDKVPVGFEQSDDTSDMVSPENIRTAADIVTEMVQRG